MHDDDNTALAIARPIALFILALLCLAFLVGAVEFVALLLDQASEWWAAL